MEGDVEKQEEVEAVTVLQTKFNYGDRIRKGAWNIGIASGLLCIAGGAYIRYLSIAGKMDEEARQFWIIMMASGCFFLSIFAILSYPFGIHLKKAAKDRNVKTLEILLGLSLLRMLAYTAFILIFGFVLDLESFIYIPLGGLIVGIYLYWVVMLCKFIQECKASSAGFDYSQFKSDQVGESPKDKVNDLDIQKC